LCPPDARPRRQTFSFLEHVPKKLLDFFGTCATFEFGQVLTDQMNPFDRVVFAVAQYFIPPVPPAVVINPLKERLLFRELQATITVEIKLERDPKEVQTFWIDDAKKQSNRYHEPFYIMVKRRHA